MARFHSHLTENLQRLLKETDARFVCKFINKKLFYKNKNFFNGQRYCYSVEEALVYYEKNFIKKMEKNDFKIIVNDFNKYFFRMTRTRLNGFLRESLADLNIEDLIINLWNLNYFKCHRKRCISCERNQYLTIKTLKQHWQEKWSEVDFVLEQIENCNEQFIDLEYLKKHKRASILNELEFIHKNF